jgi:hypothetical protein
MAIFAASNVAILISSFLENHPKDPLFFLANHKIHPAGGTVHISIAASALHFTSSLQISTTSAIYR